MSNPLTEDMRLVYYRIYHRTLARLKTTLTSISRFIGVRDALHEFNNYSIIGIFIKLDLAEALEFAPIQESMLAAMYELGYQNASFLAKFLLSVSVPEVTLLSHFLRIK